MPPFEARSRANGSCWTWPPPVIQRYAVIAVVVAAVASVDLGSRRIPNRPHAWGGGCGVVAMQALLNGWSGLLTFDVRVGRGVGAVHPRCIALGGMGAGDVKLLGGDWRLAWARRAPCGPACTGQWPAAPWRWSSRWHAAMLGPP